MGTKIPGAAPTGAKDETRRRFLRNLMYGIAYLILVLPWPIVAYVTRVPAGTETIAVGPTRGSVNAAPNYGSEQDSSSDIDTSDRQLLNQYGALVEYMKYFVPGYGYLLLTGLVVLGFFFVNGRVSDARAELIQHTSEGVKKVSDEVQKQLDRSSETLRKELDDSKERITEGLIKAGTAGRLLEEALTQQQKEIEDERSKTKESLEDELEEIRRQMLMLRVESDYRMAALCWRTQDTFSAIHHLLKIFKPIEELTAKTQNEDDSQMLMQYREGAISDLAYYYATHYERRKDYGQEVDEADMEVKRNEALRLARKLIDSIEQGLNEQPIDIVDNFLFVISRVESTNWRDIKCFKALLKDHEAQLHRHLIDVFGRKQGIERLTSYVTFINKQA